MASLIAKKFKADEQRGDGTVRHAAEERGHANRSTKRGCEASHISKHETEGGPSREGGNDLAAL